MRKSCGVLPVLLAVLAAACSGGSSKDVLKDAPLTGTETAIAGQPSPSPVATSTAATGIDWSHRLAIYTAQIGVEQGSNQTYVKRAVFTWDLDEGRLAAAFEYSGSGEYAVVAALAGHEIVFATEARVVRSHLDGTDQQELLKAGEGKVIEDIRVSPDARLLAVVVSPRNIPEPGDLYVLDVGTGAERLHVRQSDPRLAGMRGTIWQAQWRNDGIGLLVSSATHSEAFGGLATVFLDGRVRLEDIQGYGNLSPSGQLWAGNVGQVGCMFVGGHELIIRDLDSGQVPVRARSESAVYTPWEWSPDGSQFVFLQQDAQDCDQLSSERQIAWVVTGSGNSFGAPTRVDDLSALHRAWYGAQLFTADCDSGNEPVVDRRGDPRLYCIDSGSLPSASRTLKVGGLPAGTAVSPEPVGVIEPGAQSAFARVKTGGDCLNVRDKPATASLSLGCFKDGVLLRLRTQPEQTAEGINWLAVETPDRRPGWASAEFLER